MTQNSQGDITVVIPTHNRMAVLRRALNGYLAQSRPEVISELLVVDDGSTDGTQSVVAEIQARAPFRIRYMQQPNRGPAAARNLGMIEAATSLLLYSDDDIIPHPDLVAQHVRWHQQNHDANVAVLGFVTWAPEIHVTPFMNWYGKAYLFHYGEIRHRRELDFRFFYTCNLSLKREFLKSLGGFDESFKMAAYEDIELGFRLCRAGLHLLYNSDAIAYHYQSSTFADACRKRMRAESARQTFLDTEAGKYFVRLNEQRVSSLAFRISKLLATCFAKSVSLPMSVLDSRLPLPGVVYHSLLWYHAQKATDVTKISSGSPSKTVA